MLLGKNERFGCVVVQLNLLRMLPEQNLNPSVALNKCLETLLVIIDHLEFSAMIPDQLEILKGNWELEDLLMIVGYLEFIIP